MSKLTPGLSTYFAKQGKDRLLTLCDVPVGLMYPVPGRFLAFAAGGTVKLGMQVYCVHVLT